MIKGGLAMANMFEKYAVDCETERKIEKAVVVDTMVDEKRTTLSLSLTVSDKKVLKMMALWSARQRLLQSSTSGFRST